MVDNLWLFQAWSHSQDFGSPQYDDGHFAVVVVAVAACHLV